MAYNNLQTTQTNPAYWVKSYDGLTYTAANSNDGNFGSDGYPSVDQVTGNVFETAACGAGLCLNIGQPDNNGDLCFLDDPASITIGSAIHTCATGGGNSLGNTLITVVPSSGLAGNPDLLFTVSSMDLGRNLHVTYAVNGGATPSNYQVFTTVASASSNWKVWAAPEPISHSPSNVNVFPWMVAGGPGRSDSVWYGDSSNLTPSSTSPGHVWNVYMNQVIWPVDASGGWNGGRPLQNFVKVSPHPMDLLDVCLSGTGCITNMPPGNRNLADFFTVTIDHNGAADIEYNDTSNLLAQPGIPSGVVEHPGAPVVTIAHQDSGPGLFGAQVPGVPTQGTNVSGLPNEPTNAPTTGMIDPSGDALYPVIKNATNGATSKDSFDLLGNQLALSSDNGTLTVTMKVKDLNATTVGTDEAAVVGSTTSQYVTRWVMFDPVSGHWVIYYAMMETNPALRGAGSDLYFAGAAQAIDLCSVSGCDPHVIVYPETGPGSNALTPGAGTVIPPTGPGQPWTIQIKVPAADVGGPLQSTLLEEVSSYAFGSARPQYPVSNAQAEADQLPLEIDGICCFNFLGSAGPGNGVPETPWTPALIGLGAALILGGITVRRRRRGRAMTAVQS